MLMQQQLSTLLAILQNRFNNYSNEKKLPESPKENILQIIFPSPLLVFTITCILNIFKIMVKDEINERNEELKWEKKSKKLEQQMLEYMKTTEIKERKEKKENHLGSDSFKDSLEEKGNDDNNNEEEIISSFSNTTLPPKSFSVPHSSSLTKYLFLIFQNYGTVMVHSGVDMSELLLLLSSNNVLLVPEENKKMTVDSNIGNENMKAFTMSGDFSISPFTASGFINKCFTYLQKYCTEIFSKMISVPASSNSSPILQLIHLFSFLRSYIQHYIENVTTLVSEEVWRHKNMMERKEKKKEKKKRNKKTKKFKKEKKILKKWKRD
jgi:hypothetical protein